MTGTDVPLLGEIPLEPAVRSAGDDGLPLVLRPDAAGSPAAMALRGVADALAARSRPLAGVSLGISPARR